MTRPASLAPDVATLRRDKVPGSFWLPEIGPGEETMFWYACPCGRCGGEIRKALVGYRFKPASHGPSWKWDGNREQPTMILPLDGRPTKACPRGWHGWLENGEWRAS
ncbi:hypothetical protein [Sagittula sp. S175]|uniref:hypothetical protein n=1 Tax=Sagittula sp. S175 TaxID=3415129 RepID=UPI003C7AB545